MAEEKSELRAALEASKKRKRLGWIIGAAVVVVALVIGGVVIANTLRGGNEVSAEGTYTVKIGVAEDRPYREAISEVAAEKGLTIEWVNLNDWVLPNTQLVSGEVDANMF